MPMGWVELVGWWLAWLGEAWPRSARSGPLKAWRGEGGVSWASPARAVGWDWLGKASKQSGWSIAPRTALVHRSGPYLSPAASLVTAIPTLDSPIPPPFPQKNGGIGDRGQQTSALPQYSAIELVNYSPNGV